MLAPGSMSLSVPFVFPVGDTPTVGEYRGGAGVTMPVPVYRPEAQYSKKALKKDEKAIEAVGKWEFKPGTKDGAPADVYATIEVNFRLLSR